jgi:hypothetical protein
MIGACESTHGDFGGRGTNDVGIVVLCEHTNAGVKSDWVHRGEREVILSLKSSVGVRRGV